MMSGAFEAGLRRPPVAAFKVLLPRGALIVATEAIRRIIGATAPYHVAMVQCLFIDPPTSLS